MLGLVALALAVCIGAANAADAPVAENPQAKGDDCIFSCGVPECAWCGDFIAACPTQVQLEVRLDEQKSNLSFDSVACASKWLSAQSELVQLLSATMIDFDQFSEGRSSFVNT